MSSTITISQTLQWCLAFTVQRPNSGVAGVANEPGLTAANKIMQTMLAAPFKWPWNRAETNFQITSNGGADYARTIADFGYLEKAWYTVAGAVPPSKELEIHQVLGVETKKYAPAKIAAQLDNNAGTITIRFLPPPEQTYQAYLTYQKAPILATSLSATWAPIPDRYAFIYETGMLALLQGMYSPQLYALNMELFFRQLIGAAEGLSETEKAIFLEDKLRMVRTEQEAVLSVRQGRQARS